MWRQRASPSIWVAINPARCVASAGSPTTVRTTGCELTAEDDAHAFRGRIVGSRRPQQHEQRVDAAMLPMYDFTLRLASLTPDPAMQFLLNSVVGRQAEIDRLLGVFAGIIPIQTYFSTRNLVSLLGVRRAARAVIAARTRHRPGSAGTSAAGAPDELSQRDGMAQISS